MNQLQDKYLQKINIQAILSIGLLILIGIFYGLLVFYLEIYSILIILAIILALIMFFNQYWGLLIIITIYPFMVGYSEGVDIVEQVFIILFCIWLIGWIIRMLIQDSGIHLNSHPLFKPSLALGILFVIASVVGLLKGASFIDVFRDLSQFVGYLLIFPVAWIVRNKVQAKKLLMILIVIGLPCYIWSSFVWWSRKFGYEYGAMNVAGIGSAYLGPFIASLWPLIILKTKRWIRILSIMAIIILGIYSISSGYRSQVLAFLIMSGVSFWALWSLNKGIKKLRGIVILFIGFFFLLWFYYGTLGYYPLPGGERARQLYLSLISPSQLYEDLSFQGRLVEAQAAFDIFKKNPLLGQGFGHHLEMYWKYGKWYEFAYSQHIWHTAILSKFGFIGFFIFIWYIGAIMKYLYTSVKETKNVYLKGFFIGAFTWIILSLFPALGSWEDRGFSTTVGLILGILPALKNANLKNAKY